MSLSTEANALLVSFFGTSKISQAQLQHAVWIANGINADGNFQINSNTYYDKYLAYYSAKKLSPLSRRRWMDLVRLLAGNAKKELRKNLVDTWNNSVNDGNL